MTPRHRLSAGAVTIEHALYAALFAAGLAVRFWGLARVPLTGMEAINSWAAWREAMAVPGPDFGLPTSALYLNVQALIFWLGANGDAAARVISTLSGALLVPVPWLMRSLLGRGVALALSALIALDPWLVAFSRTADGAMLSTLLAVLVLALLIKLALPENGEGGSSGAADSDSRSPQRGATLMVAVASGLFLASGQMAWSFFPVLALFVFLNFAALRQSFRIDWTVLALFAGALILGATGWLVNPGGFGLISASLTSWVDLAVTRDAALGHAFGGAYPASWPWGRLLSDQPLTTLLGIAGIVYMTWRRRPPTYGLVHWQVFLIAWLAWGGALNILPGRSPFTLLLLVLPLLFGAAHALGVLAASAPVGRQWHETIAVIGIVLLLLVSAGLWASAVVSNSVLDFVALQPVLLLLLLSCALLVFVGIWIGWRAALWAGIASFGIALLLVNVGATWRVNHRYEIGRVPGLFSESGAQDLRQLAADIETLSAQTTGDGNEIEVIVDEAGQMGPNQSTSIVASEPSRQALLAWYLREMRRIHWGESADGATARYAPLVIATAAGETVPPLLAGANYAGSEYRIRVGMSGTEAESPVSPEVQGLRPAIQRVWSERLQPWLRWSLYRSGGASPVGDFVTLWAPRDD